MIDLIKKYKELLLYGIFGVLTTIVNIVVYSLCTHMFSINYLISTVIAWLISVLFAYITNRMYVFESKSSNILKEMLSFFSFRVLSGAIDIIIMYVFVDLFRWNDIFVKILSNIIVIILNYIFSKLFVFKNNKNK